MSVEDECPVCRGKGKVTLDVAHNVGVLVGVFLEGMKGAGHVLAPDIRGHFEAAEVWAKDLHDHYKKKVEAYLGRVSS